MVIVFTTADFFSLSFNSCFIIVLVVPKIDHALWFFKNYYYNFDGSYTSYMHLSTVQNILNKIPFESREAQLKARFWLDSAFNGQTQVGFWCTVLYNVSLYLEIRSTEQETLGNCVCSTSANKQISFVPLRKLPRSECSFFSFSLFKNALYFKFCSVVLKPKIFILGGNGYNLKVAFHAGFLKKHMD